MLTRRFPLAALVAFAVVVGIAVGLRLIAWNEEGARNEVGIGGPFALHDGDGRVVTDQDFRGRYMLVYFGYTYCPDICPATLSILSSALDKLPPDERAQVAPIFITVDPDRDTPAVVKTYVAAFHPSIIGLSGSESEIAAVEKIYRVYAARVPNDDPKAYSVDHSSIVYLMGPDGKLLTHFTFDVKADEMAARLHKYLS